MVPKKYLVSLTVAVLVSGFAAGAWSQAKKTQDNSADQKELHDFALTMDKIHKLGNAQKDLDALQKSNPELAKGMNSDDSEGSLDQVTQKLEKFPQAVAVLRKDGLAPREYVDTVMTLIRAGTIVGLKRAGTFKDYPPQMLELVSQANLTLVEQHYDEIGKIVPDFSNVEGGGDSGGEKDKH